jgi:hypothetical protein
MQSNAGTKGNSPSASDGEFPQVELKKKYFGEAAKSA